MPISDRQEALLRAIITDYTVSAKPVSSGQLAERKDLDVSPATVRNDMAVLEEAGFLQQPYTSAGRIPTEKAWRWYVQQIDEGNKVNRKNQERLQTVAHTHRDSEQDMLRQLAKTLADVADETIIIAFGKTDTYYTGLSNLFQQPEFEDVDELQNLSRVVDHLDVVMARLFERIRGDVQILVGTENPISPQCGTLLVRYDLPRRQAGSVGPEQRSGLIGILGPLRQDYSGHMALLRFTQSLLNTVEHGSR